MDVKMETLIRCKEKGDRVKGLFRKLFHSKFVYCITFLVYVVISKETYPY